MKKQPLPLLNSFRNTQTKSKYPTVITEYGPLSKPIADLLISQSKSKREEVLLELQVIIEFIVELDNQHDVKVNDAINRAINHFQKEKTNV